MKDNAAGEAAMPHLAAVYEKALTPTEQGLCGCLGSSTSTRKARCSMSVKVMLPRHVPIIALVLIACQEAMQLIRIPHYCIPLFDCHPLIPKLLVATLVIRDGSQP